MSRATGTMLYWIFYAKLKQEDHYVSSTAALFMIPSFNLRGVKTQDLSLYRAPYLHHKVMPPYSMFMTMRKGVGGSKSSKTTKLEKKSIMGNAQNLNATKLGA